MGSTASQLEKGVEVECKARLRCEDKGPPEYLEEGSPELDGDVRDSQAMTNHKLLKAAREGDVEGIRKMLEKGAYLETRRPFVMTPESAASPDSTSQTRGTGLTPLMYAAHGGYEQAVEALLTAGACVNSEDEDGMRPLHFAAGAGNADACKMLLRGRADPHAFDDEGRQAIEYVPAQDVATPKERAAWHGLLLEIRASNQGGFASTAAAIREEEEEGEEAEDEDTRTALDKKAATAREDTFHKPQNEHAQDLLIDSDRQNEDLLIDSDRQNKDLLIDTGRQNEDLSIGDDKQSKNLLLDDGKQNEDLLLEDDRQNEDLLLGDDKQDRDGFRQPLLAD